MTRRKSPREEVEAGLGALFPRVWRYCLVLTANPVWAEDLAQSACLRALEKSDKFLPGTHLDRWVFRIAQRVWLNELRADSLRRGGGMASIDDTDIPDTRPGPETNIMVREVLSEVFALPEAQRATVILVYVEGFSYKEAAGILDIPIGTVMSRLAAARAKLARKFRIDEGKVG